MRVKTLFFSAVVVAAVTLITSYLIGPRNLNDLIMKSLPGAVLVGRVALVYELVYMATGNNFLSILSGILFNNAMSLTAAFAAPPVLHLIYTQQGRKTWWKPRLFPAMSWKGFQTVIYSIAVIFLSLFTVAIVTVLLVSGPAYFMATESAYIVISALVLVKASQTPPEELLTVYSKTLKKTLPIIIALLTTSAVIETYEILLRLHAIT